MRSPMDAVAARPWNMVQLMTESSPLELVLVEGWANAAVRHVNGRLETNFRGKFQYFHIFGGGGVSL